MSVFQAKYWNLKDVKCFNHINIKPVVFMFKLNTAKLHIFI